MTVLMWCVMNGLHFIDFDWSTVGDVCWSYWYREDSCDQRQTGEKHAEGVYPRIHHLLG